EAAPAGERRFDGRDGDVDAAGEHDVVGAAEHREPLRRTVLQRAEVLGAQVPHAGDVDECGCGGGRVVVAAREDGPGDQDASGVVEREVHAVEGHPVVHA